MDNEINLLDLISPPDSARYRCRVIYGRDIESVEYIPYTPREIGRIAVVDSDIEYRYKYADRTKLDSLLLPHMDYDDLLIVRDGLITDTTIANVAFSKDGRWYTPKTPLLEGTTRQRLLDNGFLSTHDINKNDISDYEHFAIMNAMIKFKIVNIDCLMVDNSSRQHLNRT